MKNLTNTSKISAIIVVVLMIVSLASIAATLPSAKASYTNVTGQAGVVAQAPTTFPVSSGYPNLGPLPSGTAQPVNSYVSDAYISVTPQTVGNNQVVLINIWTSPGMYHAFYMQGYYVNIIKPDGTTEELGPVNSYMGDATYYWDYQVNEVGTWSFQFVSPGTYIPTGVYVDSPTGQAFFPAPGNQYYLGAAVYYEPSTTPWYNITVQPNFVQNWPPAALPGAGDYWTRPINPMNREWAPIGGNYPFTGSLYYADGTQTIPYNWKYTPYVQSPTSAHIVWRLQTAFEGLIGGSAGAYTDFGSSGTPAVIYDGNIYQTFSEIYMGSVQTVLESINLQTGQVNWEEPCPTTVVQTLFGPVTEAIAPQYITYQLGTSEAIPGGTDTNTYTVRLVFIGSSLIEWNPFNGQVTLNATLPSYMVSNSAQGGNVVSPSSVFYNDPYCLSVEVTGNGSVANPTEYWLINWTITGYSGNAALFPNQVQNNCTWTTFENLVNSAPGDTESYDFDAGIAVLGGWNPVPGPQWCIGYLIATASMKTGAMLVDETSNDTGTYNVNNGASLVTYKGTLAMACENGHWNAWSETTGALGMDKPINSH